MADDDDPFFSDTSLPPRQIPTGRDTETGASNPSPRKSISPNGPTISPAEKALLSQHTDTSLPHAKSKLAAKANTLNGIRGENQQTLFQAFGDGLHMIGHAFSVFRRYPVFLLPLLGCWCVYAPVVLYFKFGAHSFSGASVLWLVFAAILVLSSALAFSGLVLLELIQQVETGRQPKLFHATRDAARHNFVKALPIILVWASLWFFLTLLSAIFSKRRSDHRDDNLNMENAARTFSGGVSFFSLRNLFRMLNKALRMLVFLILPAIAWLDCGPLKATKLGFVAVRQHLRHFAAGFILSEVVAMLIFLPTGILIYVVDQGNYSLPDAAWLGVIFYCAFGWSFVIYIEQMFAAELFLWHIKWCDENKELASQNLSPKTLSEIQRPSLLDDVAELLDHRTDVAEPREK